MDITKEDIDLLKQGLFDLNSEQNWKKLEEIKKRIDEHYSRLNIPNAKSGARFSEDTKSALSEHVKSVMDVSKKMQNMSDELATHARALKKKADDLTNLYQSEGQGSAFAAN